MHQKSLNVIYVFTKSHFIFKTPPNFWETDTQKDGKESTHLKQPIQQA